MLRAVIISVLIVVFLLAQGPAAWRTVDGVLRLGERTVGPSDVISTERAKELSAKGLRGQLVSLGEPEALRKDEAEMALDQRYQLFAIPVEQISLDEPEKIGPTPEWRPESNDEGVSRYAARGTSGRYSNIILFDRSTGRFQKLFDKRVSISQFRRGWSTRPEVLVIFATEKDTDRNGVMDDDDIQDLYVVTLNDRVVHRVEGFSANPLGLVEIPNVDFVVVRARVDRNGDGRTPAYTYREGDVPEPDLLFRIDLKTFVATPFVPGSLLSDLQQTLDATKPATSSK